MEDLGYLWIIVAVSNWSHLALSKYAGHQYKLETEKALQEPYHSKYSRALLKRCSFCGTIKNKYLLSSCTVYIHIKK